MDFFTLLPIQNSVVVNRVVYTSTEAGTIISDEDDDIPEMRLIGIQLNHGNASLSLTILEESTIYWIATSKMIVYLNHNIVTNQTEIQEHFPDKYEYYKFTIILSTGEKRYTYQYNEGKIYLRNFNLVKFPTEELTFNWDAVSSVNQLFSCNGNAAIINYDYNHCTVYIVGKGLYLESKITIPTELPLGEIRIRPEKNWIFFSHKENDLAQIEFMKSDFTFIDIPLETV